MNDNSLYRPDIDGLRAIAVMSVLLYHSGFGALSGGFVGVDVFFVISGYLITRLLHSEVRRTGSIDFYGFYLRRLRRIFPALIFTLGGASVAAIFILTPQRLEQYGGSLLHAMLSASNIFFFFESGYFDTDSALKPLLHTWSLGVEEQFYILWPFVILLFAASNRRLYLAITLLGLITLILAAGLIGTYPSAVFFLVPFRVFEFAIGAVLVTVERNRSKNLMISNALFSIGLSLMLVAILSYDEHTQFPGLSALVPCIGAALCIYSPGHGVFGRVLSNKPVVWVGLISYSLYLTHWPIIVFYKYTLGIQELTPVESVSIVLASFVAAILMYRFIEKPFRKSGTENRRFLLVITIASLLITYIGASLWASDGWVWRPWINNSISVDAINKGKELRSKDRQLQCVRKGWDSCDDLANDQVNALIVGDSHALDGLNAFTRIFPSHNFSMSTLGGCPPYHEIEKLTLPTHPDLDKCKGINVERYDVGYLKRYDYIVISVLFGWYSPDHLREYLRFLNDAGISKVIIIGGYLSMTEDLPELINKHGFDRSLLNEFISGSVVDDQALIKEVRDLGYFFLSKFDAFCEQGDCELFDEDMIPFSYDQHHLSYEFAQRVAIKRQREVSSYLGDVLTKPRSAPGDSAELRLGDWGPRGTQAGVIPNLQPDGGMGIWIKLSGAYESRDVEVWFNGKPAIKTVVQDELITASVSPSEVNSKGSKPIVIKTPQGIDLKDVGFFVVSD